MDGELDTVPVMDDHERLRYITYFQKTLVSEGSEDYLAEQKLWFERNRERLAVEYDAIVAAEPRGTAAAINPFIAHRDRLAFDSVFATQIFEPILKKSLEAATSLGYAIQRPVELVNSPGVEPTAAVLPSIDRHTLFIGHGTSSFCNYWSKVFADVIYGVGALPPDSKTAEAVMLAIRTNPILTQAMKLVLRYARSESLLGFGELTQEAHLHAFRNELLRAMETFVVGHEIGHLFLHEQFPESNGEPPGMSLREMELTCDLVGFRICSEVGELEQNFSSKHLVGPLLLFSALRLCEDVQDILLGRSRCASDTHPSTKERIQRLGEFAVRADPSGVLWRYLEESLDYALILSTHIKGILTSIRDGEAK